MCKFLNQICSTFDDFIAQEAIEYSDIAESEFVKIKVFQEMQISHFNVKKY